MFRAVGLRNVKWVTGLAFEGGLVFGSLYGLALLTQTWSAGVDLPFGSLDVDQMASLASIVFLSAVFAVPPRRLRGTISLRRQLILSSVLCGIIGLIAFAACWTLTESSRSLGWLMLEGSVAVPIVVSAWRWTAQQFRVLDGRRERILIVGTSESARSVARWIAEHRPQDYAVTGFASQTRDRVGEIVAAGVRVTTDFAGMSSACVNQVDRIVVALEEKRGVLPTEELMQLRLTGIVIEDATSFFERTTGKIAVENLLPSWLIFADGFRVSRARIVAKRVSDLVLSGALLVVSAPAMAIVALAVKLESPGPVLFRQRRVGLRGREFELIKFRSMVVDAEERSGPAWASSDDPRVTRLGRWMRRTRIDELPQLINVLRGEMSFVGPRPERRHFVEQLRREIPYFDLRLAVRPGITGWAQVQYGYGASVEENREKMKYDLFYVKHLGFFLDLWIVLKTVGVVLRGSGAR